MGKSKRAAGEGVEPGRTAVNKKTKKREKVNWSEEFMETMDALVADDSQWELLGSLMQGWDISKLKQLVADWRGEMLGVILTGWPTKRLASLLAKRKSSVLTKCCEAGWSPRQIGRFLSRCSVSKAHKVLDDLYFGTPDPFLSHKGIRKVLQQWKKRKELKKLCHDWDSKWVEAILRGEAVAPHAKRIMKEMSNGPASSGSESDYESSFIDDESEGSEIEGSEPESDAEIVTLTRKKKRMS